MIVWKIKGDNMLFTVLFKPRPFIEREYKPFEGGFEELDEKRLDEELQRLEDFYNEETKRVDEHFKKENKRLNLAFFLDISIFVAVLVFAALQLPQYIPHN